MTHAAYTDDINVAANCKTYSGKSRRIHFRKQYFVNIENLIEKNLPTFFLSIEFQFQ